MLKYPAGSAEDLERHPVLDNVWLTELKFASSPTTFKKNHSCFNVELM